MGVLTCHIDWQCKRGKHDQAVTQITIEAFMYTVYINKIIVCRHHIRRLIRQIYNLCTAHRQPTLASFIKMVSVDTF